MDINEFLTALNSVNPDTLIDVARQIASKVDLEMIENLNLPRACWEEWNYC